MYNKVDTYIEGRCITPPEARWRLFVKEIQKKSHSAQRLDIHLPGQFRNANIALAQEDLADTGQKGSTLEAYFRYNRGLKQTEENNPTEILKKLYITTIGKFLNTSNGMENPANGFREVAVCAFSVEYIT